MEGYGFRVSLFLLNEINDSTGLILGTFGTPIPAYEKTTECIVSGVTRNPDFAIVFRLPEVFIEHLEGSAPSFVIRMLKNSAAAYLRNFF